MQLNAVIIDDEPDNIEVLEILVQRECPSVQIAKSFTDAAKGFRYLKENHVDIAFLDIELRSQTAFDYLAGGNIKSRIIFTTAYSEYAVNAFKVNAVDYLLKPIHSEDLKRAVEKATKLIALERRTDSAKYRVDQQTVILTTHLGNRVALVDDVICLNADNVYTEVFLEDEKPLLIVKPLKVIERLLPGNLFYRVHRSHIINLNKVKFVRKSRRRVILKNDVEVPVSKFRYREFSEALKAAS